MMTTRGGGSQRVSSGPTPPARGIPDGTVEGPTDIIAGGRLSIWLRLHVYAAPGDVLRPGASGSRDNVLRRRPNIYVLRGQAVVAAEPGKRGRDESKPAPSGPEISVRVVAGGRGDI